jgi:hypothetical protein
MDCLTLEDGSDWLSRYVGTELRNSTLRNIREEADLIHIAAEA